MAPPIALLTSLLLFLAFLSPIVAAAFLAVFKGRGVRGRWLFLVAGPVIAYSILWVFTLVFIIPAYIVLTLFTPAVKELLDHTPYWYPFASWFVRYEVFIAGFACALLALWLVAYLWPRWSSVLYALAAKPERSNAL
jgi:hypothetical protein